MPPRKRIIAVFGGSKDPEVLDFAERLGAAIAASNAIVLTGGTKPAMTPLKNRAICGAYKAGKSSQWIGVDRKQDGAPFWSARTRCFLIRSNLDHQRNYIEACMSDAAICLDGGLGTLSELVCSLSFKRPVAVSDGWKGTLDLETTPPRGLAEAISSTTDLFTNKSKGVEHLRPKIIAAPSFRGSLRGLGEFRYFGLSTPADDVIQWITDLLPSHGELPGHFPQVSGHDRVAEEYAKWLENV